MKNLSLMLYLAMFAWGSNWVSAKILMDYFNAYELIFWRFFIAAFGLFFVIIYMKISFKIDKREIFYSFICSIVLCLYNYFFFLGDHFGNASLGGVLVTTLNPVLTFFALAMIAKKALKKSELLALILGVFGSFLIIKIWRFNLNDKGIVYFLLATVTWVILTIVSSKIKKENSLVFSFLMFLFSTVFIYLTFLKLKIPRLDIDLKGWVNLLSLSVFGTTFATAAYFYASSVIGGKRASAYIFLVPFSAVILSWIFLKEKIDIFVIIGGIISLTGVYILNGYSLEDVKALLKRS
ncbi:MULTISPECIES: DMT family transporter [unclassified Lebetimonas]|uniref:DMT family transporter n=1 Tax=unclassified Lebetimonas TaxID=2648158 RepID=UPI000464A5D7|nr:MULTISPECIES: DMT family transporter [unclassified Lebetimonas]